MMRHKWRFKKHVACIQKGFINLLLYLINSFSDPFFISRLLICKKLKIVMNKRKTLMLAGRVLIVALIIWFFSKGSPGKEKAEFTNPIKYRHFEVIPVKNTSPLIRIPVTGRVRAIQKIDLYPQVGGKLLEGKKPFKEGVTFRRGELLLQVDSESFQLDLKAQKSTFLNTLVQLMADLKMDFADHASPWEVYLTEFNLNKKISSLPLVKHPKLKYFLATKDVYNQYYVLKRMEEDLEDYYIPAPFAGVISAVHVDPGAQVGTQTHLGEISSVEAYELKASISLSDLRYVKVQDEVLLTNVEIDRQWRGSIQRIGSVVNDDNQQLNVFIDVKGKNLKEGIFLEGVITSGRETNRQVMVLPLASITRNEQVYVVKDSLVQARPVKMVRYHKEEVWVTGLQDGELVIKAPGNEPVHGMKGIAKLN